MLKERKLLMSKYREWPLGIPPKELQNKELDEVRELGYDW